jgi:nucleotide-binding universal stress UspA family protein
MSRIVVGHDGSTNADRALHWAVREAELRASPIELVQGYVIHPHAALFGTSDHDLAKARMKTILERNQALLDHTRWTTTLVPLIASPTSALIDAGEDADLIVVGSRGLGGFDELFVGSTSYRTAAHASSPVAVIRGGHETEALDAKRPIVAGIDGSRAGRRALRWALDEAARRTVSVTVAHAYYAPSDLSAATITSPDQTDRYRERAYDEAVALVDHELNDVGVPASISVERVVTAGSPAGVLLNLAGPDQLLVVGTRGHGALGRAVFGSVSHQCLHHATGNVVVVP